MQKQEIRTIAEKKRIAGAIIDEMIGREYFLLLGHENPDTDCIASLASFGLLLRKLDKQAVIYLAGPVQEQFNYLLAICRYNGIVTVYGDGTVPGEIDTLVILDTPKPEMIAANTAVRALLADPSIRKIEVDHHLEGDAVYTGDRNCSLVSEASSTCEHIGYICYKMSRRPDLGKIDFFSRNVALAILTGIVGDSGMGKYLKSDRERRYYQIFSTMFDQLLVEKTYKNSGNLASISAVFDVLKRFSVQERACFDRICGQRWGGKNLLAVSLDRNESADIQRIYGEDLLVNISRTVADTLAEESGKLGIVAYYNHSSTPGFVQFRLRRSSGYSGLDLRQVIGDLGISNGGGHPGAVAFRLPEAEVADIRKITGEFARKIESL
ncbi:MAG: DHH family phosphoesterase [Treponema sp.]|jgi:nanoRNase/pAp phosphatase (c-di-AMP/oligoRNAs hydrolase)|nr:DHH family phosphoesterase [Treponema sp.]